MTRSRAVGTFRRALPQMRKSGFPPRLGPAPLVMAVILVGVIGIAALILLEACGALLPFSRWGLSGCQVAAAGVNTELEKALGQQVLLENRVSELETRLARMSCRPEPPPPAPPPPEPEPPGGLDAEQWQEQDIRLLEGCWALDSFYQITEVTTGATSTVSDWDMCFDSAGNGNQTIRFDNGTTCTEETTAQFNAAGKLEIHDKGDVHCSDRSYIFRRVSTCDLEPDGTAACKTVQPERGPATSDVRIRRP